MSDTLKRWLVIGGLLLITLWLAFTVPTVDTADVVEVNRTKVAKVLNTRNVNKNELILQPRPVSTAVVFDVFSVQTKPVFNQIKPVISARPKPKSIKARAPRMPFKYIGQLAENKTKKIFLMKGDALYIVTEGDKIDSDYQLIRVKSKQLSVLYIPLNITQTINIGRTP